MPSAYSNEGSLSDLTGTDFYGDLISLTSVWSLLIFTNINENQVRSNGKAKLNTGFYITMAECREILFLSGLKN